jgi:hypothetical protein
MDESHVEGDLVDILFNEKQIQDRLAELAVEIERDYADKDILLVGVLRGAVMVMADLARHFGEVRRLRHPQRVRGGLRSGLRREVPQPPQHRHPGAARLLLTGDNGREPGTRSRSLVTACTVVLSSD